MKKEIRWLLIALVALIVIGFVVWRLRSKSNYVYPGQTGLTGTASSLYEGLDSNVYKCQDAFSLSNDNTTYQNCLNSNVYWFTSNICPAVDSTVTTAALCTSKYPIGNCNLTSLAGTGGVAWFPTTTAGTVSNVLQNDVQTVTNAYTDFVNRAGQTVSGTTFPNIDVVSAARRADLKGATRKYLSNLCAGFYNSNTLTSSGTYQPNDPSSIFRGWNTNGTGTYSFSDASRLNATVTQHVSNVNTYGTWAARLPAAGTNEIDVTTVTCASGSGCTASAATVGNVTIPKWVVAQNFGPGTILTGGTQIPLTWNNGTDVVTVTYTVPSNGTIFT